jgi:hypothetical protein
LKLPPHPLNQLIKRKHEINRNGETVIYQRIEIRLTPCWLVLMKSIVNDLSEDIKIYEDYQIPANEQCLKNVDSLLISLITNQLEDANNLLPMVFQIENYSPSSSTYNSMKNSGKQG